MLNDLWAKRGTCDDVLIVKGDLITDSWYCNILFSNGKNWYTPDQPLLAGTCRARLLAEGKIMSRRIEVEDLHHFTHFKLVNAMRDIEEVAAVPTSQIFK
jgi:4-amino-4-deoxychorismate lyase